MENEFPFIQHVTVFLSFMFHYEKVEVTYYYFTLHVYISNKLETSVSYNCTLNSVGK